MAFNYGPATPDPEMVMKTARKDRWCCKHPTPSLQPNNSASAVLGGWVSKSKCHFCHQMIWPSRSLLTAAHQSSHLRNWWSAMQSPCGAKVEIRHGHFNYRHSHRATQLCVPAPYQCSGLNQDHRFCLPTRLSRKRHKFLHIAGHRACHTDSWALTAFENLLSTTHIARWSPVLIWVNPTNN
jgi:hypothetical protein